VVVDDYLKEDPAIRLYALCHIYKNYVEEFDIPKDQLHVALKIESVDDVMNGDVLRRALLLNVHELEVNYKFLEKDNIPYIYTLASMARYYASCLYMEPIALYVLNCMWAVLGPLSLMTEFSACRLPYLNTNNLD